MMGQPILESLIAILTSPRLAGLLLLAVPIGLLFGVIPGLGGKLAIVVTMPFVFGMDKAEGCIFLISLHAVVGTGGAVPAILFGIPGTGPSTATVVDGYMMTRNGEAGRALGAAVAASVVGGVIGAAAFAGLIPLALPIVKLISYPEIFALALFGISLSAALSGNEVLKGLITAALGLMLAFVGVDGATGVPRFTYGQLFLWDGVDLIAAVIAIFAIPEMIDLGRRGGSIAPPADAMRSMSLGAAMQGVRDVAVHRWLTLRTSLIGAWIGLVPGLGGDVAAWMCYGHALQTSRHPERFGHGSVEGVIGPETANNSKEGGALVPTLFLGIPGSSGMAVLLVALLPLGVVPGPGFALGSLDLVWMMVWALVLSNVVAGVALLLVTRQLAVLTRIDGHYLVPFVFLSSIVGVYLAGGEWRLFVLMAALGVLGYFLKREGWPRAPFVLGLVLGHSAEDAFNKSLGLMGPTFFLRPAALLILLATLASVVLSVRRERRRDAARAQA